MYQDRAAGMKAAGMRGGRPERGWLVFIAKGHDPAVGLQHSSPVLEDQEQLGVPGFNTESPGSLLDLGCASPSIAAYLLTAHTVTLWKPFQGPGFFFLV